jgi:hypothetical protein
MQSAFTVPLRLTDRKCLQAIVDGRNSPQKHVRRARIVLATAVGLGTVAIMRLARGQQDRRQALAGALHGSGVGWLRDKTRPARVPRLADEVAERIVALTLREPPGETTHWRPVGL